MSFTTGGPMVRLGTKWPSITSTCRRSAWGATPSMASARAAKSADRMDGAMRAIAVNLPGPPQRNEEHAVGAAGLRQQEGAPTMPLPGLRRRGQRSELGVAAGQPVVDTDGLVGGERAHAVDERAARRQERNGAVEQGALEPDKVGDVAGLVAPTG